MTRILILGSLLAFLGLQAQEPKPDPKRAKIEQLLVLQKTEWQMEQAIVALDEYMAKTRKEAGLEQSVEATEKGKRYRELVRERTSWARLKEGYIALYAETYTEPELDALIAFHKTAGGQAMVEKMPKVMQQSLEIPQKIIVKMMPEIQRMVGETLQKVQQ
jgi:uncharacterized protein